MARWHRVKTALCVAAALKLVSLTGVTYAQSPSVIKIAVNKGPEGDPIRSMKKVYKDYRIETIDLAYSSLHDLLLTSLQSGRHEFDIVMIDDPWFPQFSSYLRPIHNLPVDLEADLVPAALKLGRVPNAANELRAVPIVGNTQLLFARTDILNRLGLSTIPNDWVSLATLASNITNQGSTIRGQRIFGYAIRGRAGAPIVTDFLPIYWSLGGKVSDDAQHPTASAVDRDLLIKALEIYKSLAEASPPGASNYDWSEMTAAFLAGRVAFELNWPAGILELSKRSHRSSIRPWEFMIPPGSTPMMGNWLLGIPQAVSDETAKECEKLIVWALQHQDEFASTGNPPTRRSVFKKLAAQPGMDFYTVVGDALEHARPRDRTPNWIKIEDIISRAVSSYLTGALNKGDAADQIVDGIANVTP